DAKGKAESPEAWLVVAARSEPGERRTAATPLVGRTNELALLRSLWAGCLGERRPHLVTVVGPPGIGKSRLCREFSAQVASDGGRLLRGRCLPYEERVGYGAFGGVVSAATGILGSDSSTVARRKLQDTLEALMPAAEASEVAAHLALMLGLSADVDVPQAAMLFFYARRLLESLGDEQPTVVVFEDVHWAQPSEVELLQYLAKHLRDSAVLLVATARPELLDRHASWSAGLTAHTTVALDPLRADEAELLAATLLHRD